MILETFPVGPLACNCTLLGDDAAGEAIVVDPGDEVDRIHRRLNEHGLRLKQILITHAHIDHVGGALRLKRLTGAPIFLNQEDLPLLEMMAVQAAWLGVDTPETAKPDEPLTEGMTVGLARYPAQVIHTPGHTQGSVCLHFAPMKWSLPATRFLPAALAERICLAAITARSSSRSKAGFSRFPTRHACCPGTVPKPPSPANAKVTPSFRAGKFCGFAMACLWIQPDAKI